ncbi:LysR family transcriptional regulator [Sphingomonas sp. I4]
MTADSSDLQVPVHRFNLNLLYPLDAILHAPTLTEAGRRVRLSQSAMSHALRRLREHFADDLITYLNGEKQLTPLGVALRDEVRRVMREVDGTFNFSLVFDP